MNLDIKNTYTPPRLTFPPDLNSMESESQEGGKPMTILIGALCDEGNTVVLLADKVTTLQPQALVFGHSTKGIELTSHSMVLTSGFASNYVFIENVKSALNPQMGILQIAENLKFGYHHFRFGKVTSEVLGTQGFTSFDEYHQKQKLLDSTLIGQLADRVGFYNLGVELLLGGIDSKGHIFYIMNPGTYQNWDEPGFACAGFAANRASPIFEFFDYSKDLTLSEVLSIVFVAKKRTEALSGIGQETDVWTINVKDGIRKISEETISKLEKRYSEIKDRFSGISKEIEIEEKEIKYLEKQGDKPTPSK